MKNVNMSLLSLPNAVIGNLSLRKKRDPRYRLSGMTSGYTPGMARARAFTLIELLVVVLIIGILAAIALPQYRVAVKKANLAKYMGLVRAIKDAEVTYYLSNNEYTTDLTVLDIQVPIGADCVFYKEATDGYYVCGKNKVRYGVWNGPTNAQAGDASIRYLQYFADYADEGSEINFKRGDIACYSKGDVARQVCKTLGSGIEHPSGNNTWDYYFVLDN